MKSEKSNHKKKTRLIDFDNSLTEEQGIVFRDTFESLTDSNESIYYLITNAITSFYDDRKEILNHKKIIQNLWHNNRYLNEYISYLLGAYTDEEFDKISSSFIREFDEYSFEEVVSAIKEVSNILQKKLSIDDLSSLLNVLPKCIDEALNDQEK